MKKNVKYFLILSIFIFLLFTKSFANEDNKFLSLKNDKVNLRQGPSFEYPIKLIYKKKFLPLVILDESGNWRKILDFKNNSGWIHTSQLSKKKTAICMTNNSLLHKKPTIFSKPLARLEVGRLVIIKSCKNEWCKISSGSFVGWISKNSLWGKTK